LIEEIFISGSEGGLLCIWNIKTKQLIKKFVEYGIYSIDKFTMNDPLDGKFSPDGSCFAVSSSLGTLSLFSCEGSKIKYEATRVE
jgi:WD40 repeat protein